MSRSIDLFLASPLPADELADELTRLTGLSFAPTADGTGWMMHDGGVQAELAEHHFADDGDLLLSRYRYALSARVPLGINPADTPEAMSLRRMTKTLHAEGSIAVLLILDLQYRDQPGRRPTSPTDGPRPAQTPDDLGELTGSAEPGITGSEAEEPEAGKPDAGEPDAGETTGRGQ
jgi:hypothetical protein